jgi:hypothetical protein
MYQELVRIMGRELKVGKNMSKDYKRGVDIHGLNNISGEVRSKLIRGMKKLPSGKWEKPNVPTYGGVFYEPGGNVNPYRLSIDDEPQTIHDILPPDIVDRLLSLREKSRVWKRTLPLRG